jgi:hypothetical protein
MKSTRSSLPLLLMGCTAFAYANISRHLENFSASRVMSSLNAYPSSNAAVEQVEKKILPSFENGGIIFFLDVPMTGGDTVGSALQEGQGRYILCDKRAQFDQYKRDLSKYVKYGTDNREIVTFELQASDTPTLMEVAERLHMWRKLAAQSNVPFFTFTVLQEPLSFAVDFFNFYYVADNKNPNYEFLDEVNEQDFVRTAAYNPQCGFLVKGADFLHETKEQQLLLQHSRCDEAYKAILDNMDWVGTTEWLNNETFPLLRSLVGSNTNADHLLEKNIKTRIMENKRISASDLSSEALQYVNNLTAFDQELYIRAKRDFPFEQMVLVEDATS